MNKEWSLKNQKQGIRYNIEQIFFTFISYKTQYMTSYYVVYHMQIENDSELVLLDTLVSSTAL